MAGGIVQRNLTVDRTRPFMFSRCGRRRGAPVASHVSIAALTWSHMPSHRRPRVTRIATQAIELGLAVPAVVAHRVTRMALAGAAPSSRDRAEFHRMGAEKVVAFHESWNGMLLAMYRANLNLLWSLPAWSMTWAGGHRRVAPTRAQQRAVLDILVSGVAPIHRRAVANAKRLGRRSRAKPALKPLRSC